MEVLADKSWPPISLLREQKPAAIQYRAKGIHLAPSWRRRPRARLAAQPKGRRAEESNWLSFGQKVDLGTLDGDVVLVLARLPMID